jgi:hypothetical protein
MRKTSGFHPALLPSLAWTALGAAALGACSLNLDYLQKGASGDGGLDENAVLADDAASDDSSVAVDGTLDDGTPDDGAANDTATNDVVDAGDAAPEASTLPLPDGGFPSCAELVVPLSAIGQQTDFTINLSANYDFTAATISVAVYAPNAGTGFIEAYIQNNTSPNYPRQQLGPQPLSNFGSWAIYTWTLPANLATGFDPTKTYYLGLSVESGATAGSFEQPNTIIYIGEIVVTHATPSVGPFVYNQSVNVSGTDASNLPTDILWLNFNDSQTTGTNYLLWDPTCGTPVAIDAGSDASVDGSAADGGHD